MAIGYPLLLIILPIIILVFLFWKKSGKREVKKSYKIANTKFVKKTAYFKEILKTYQVNRKIMMISFVVAIISSILLICRIQITETHGVNEYKRDIMLCMDVSASVDELNIETIETLKKTVKSLKGERFAISMFNTTSVLVSPLTDDYEYILTSLDEIEKSIQANSDISFSNILDENFYYIRNYIYIGTIEGNETRGSSLIGDGLASCVYSFPKQQEERTRIIIFTTDNDLAGTPIVTLDKAAEISKKRKILVYGIGTKYMKNKDALEMKKAVEKTGGVYYQQSGKTVKGIVSEIEKTSKSLTSDHIETTKTDLPTVPFILLLVSFSTIIICYRKVMV